MVMQSHSYMHAQLCSMYNTYVIIEHASIIIVTQSMYYIHIAAYIVHLPTVHAWYIAMYSDHLCKEDLPP